MEDVQLKMDSNSEEISFCVSLLHSMELKEAVKLDLFLDFCALELVRGVRIRRTSY